MKKTDIIPTGKRKVVKALIPTPKRKLFVPAQYFTINSFCTAFSMECSNMGFCVSVEYILPVREVAIKYLMFLLEKGNVQQIGDQNKYRYLQGKELPKFDLIEFDSNTPKFSITKGSQL